jgi:hypothetical protein
MDLDAREAMANEGLVLAMVDVLRQPPGAEVCESPTAPRLCPVQLLLLLKFSKRVHA